MLRAGPLFRTLTFVVSVGGAARGIALDIGPAEMERVLAIARGPETAREAFHAPYRFEAALPVESIEVITERRRLALIAAERIALGDPLFTRGTLRAEEALRPWRRRVAIAVRFAFPPNNAYTLAPPIDIALTGGESRLLDSTAETLFAMPPSPPGRPQPVVGARGEAIFDATTLAQATRTLVVTLGPQEVARVTIDFSRLD
jgi:hypothetical protein